MRQMYCLFKLQKQMQIPFDKQKANACLGEVLMVKNRESIQTRIRANGAAFALNLHLYSNSCVKIERNRSTAYELFLFT